ncbi:hypothetical protein DP464_08070 [Salmonella enterica]|nr:hypothetical protein [Salmonella enterica]
MHCKGVFYFLFCAIFIITAAPGVDGLIYLFQFKDGAAAGFMPCGVIIPAHLLFRFHVRRFNNTVAVDKLQYIRNHRQHAAFA